MKKIKKAKKAKLSLVEPTLFGYSAPFVASETSYEAAQQIAPKVKNLREIVYNALKAEGPLTDEEIAHRTRLNPSTARPRRLELQRAGRIVEAGFAYTESGRRARLWRVA